MSDICKGAVCQVSEVGRLMVGISKACGNDGNCQLPDIMQVVVNIGNFVLFLVGAVVFLMYVIGGFWFLIAHGNMEYVKKGKAMMMTATVGLLIVFFAFAGVQFLRNALTGTTGVQNGGEYVVCSGKDTEDKPCALNSKCRGFVCMSQCEILDTAHEGYGCFDRLDPTFENQLTCDRAVDLCAGGDSVECCKVK